LTLPVKYYKSRVRTEGKPWTQIPLQGAGYRIPAYTKSIQLTDITALCL